MEHELIELKIKSEEAKENWKKWEKERANKRNEL